MKQLTLGILMYTQDFDEYYPMAVDGGYSGGNWLPNDSSIPSHWQQRIAPYLKSLGIFGCPDDPNAGTLDPNGTWSGVETSYLANGYWNWIPSSASGGWQPTLMGPMGDYNYNWNKANGWGYKNSTTGSLNDSQVGRPSQGILLAEVFTSDLDKANGGQDPINHNWNPGYSSNSAWGEADYISGCSWMGSGLMIPYGGGQPTDGGPANISNSLPSGNAVLDTAPNYAVIPHHAGNQLTNFAFCDGHVKAMHPAATDPQGNGYLGDSSNTNMWNVLN